MKNGALTAVWVKELLGCLQGVKMPTLLVERRFSKKGSASSSGTAKSASSVVVAAVPAEGKGGSDALPEKAQESPLEEMSGSEIDLAFLSQASIVSVGSSVSEAVVPLAGQKDFEASMKKPACQAKTLKRPAILKVKAPGSAGEK